MLRLQTSTMTSASQPNKLNHLAVSAICSWLLSISWQDRYCEASTNTKMVSNVNYRNMRKMLRSLEAKGHVKQNLRIYSTCRKIRQMVCVQGCSWKMGKQIIIMNFLQKDRIWQLQGRNHTLGDHPALISKYPYLAAQTRYDRVLMCASGYWNRSQQMYSSQARQQPSMNKQKAKEPHLQPSSCWFLKYIHSSTIPMEMYISEIQWTLWKNRNTLPTFLWVKLFRQKTLTNSSNSTQATTSMMICMYTSRMKKVVKPVRLNRHSGGRLTSACRVLRAATDSDWVISEMVCSTSPLAVSLKIQREFSAFFSQLGTWKQMNEAMTLSPSYMCCGMMPLTRMIDEVICTPGSTHASTPVCAISLTPDLFRNSCTLSATSMISNMICFQFQPLVGALMQDHVRLRFWPQTDAWKGRRLAACRLGYGMAVVITFTPRLYMKMYCLGVRVILQLLSLTTQYSTLNISMVNIGLLNQKY